MGVERMNRKNGSHKLQIRESH